MVTVDSKWKRIGISLSGGADSALLAYLVCANTTADIHIVTQTRCWKTRPWQQHVSLKVYNWLQQRFPNLQFTRHEGFIPPELEWGRTGPNLVDEYGKLKSGNQIILRAHNEFIIHKEGLDAWFAGVNKNPDIEIDGALEDRNKGHLPLKMQHIGATICHPFVNTTKDWIVGQYYANNLEELFNITRSCEGDATDYPEVFGDLDYTNYVPGMHVPVCNQCFWCKERQWAINNAKT